MCQCHVTPGDRPTKHRPKGSYVFNSFIVMGNKALGQNKNHSLKADYGKALIFKKKKKD